MATNRGNFWAPLIQRLDNIWNCWQLRGGAAAMTQCQSTPVLIRHGDLVDEPNPRCNFGSRNRWTPSGADHSCEWQDWPSRNEDHNESLTSKTLEMNWGNHFGGVQELKGKTSNSNGFWSTCASETTHRHSRHSTHGDHGWTAVQLWRRISKHIRSMMIYDLGIFHVAFCSNFCTQQITAEITAEHQLNPWLDPFHRGFFCISAMA